MAELLTMHAPAPAPLSILRNRIALSLMEQGRYPIG
jgi:hypothetical protein